MKHPSHFLPDAAVCARYRVSKMTVHRWRTDGVSIQKDPDGAPTVQTDPKLKFPKPDVVINGRNYTRVTTLDAFDEFCASATEVARVSVKPSPQSNNLTEEAE